MALSNAKQLADDPTKNIVIYINDYYPEYGAAFPKLAEKLGRPLKGVMLIDKKLKDAGQNLPDPTGVFEEVVCDFSNDGELRATIRRFEDNLLLVSCSGEGSQMDFQRVLPHIPYVPAPTERSLEWATHKGKMRELIGAYSPQLVPKVQPVENANEGEIQKVLGALTFPVMIKPTGLSDSALVTKAHNEDELRVALDDAFDALHDTYKRNRGNGKPGIIVEEFMDGDQFTIDGYVDAVGNIYLLPLLHSISSNRITGLGGFNIYQVETHHGLTDEEIAVGKRASEDAIHAIGLRSSIAHIELFKTADGWKIIEIGARPGAYRQEIYEVSYGVDHALNELLIKIGLPPEMGKGHLTHSQLVKVYPQTAGILSEIEGLDKARLHPAVYKVTPYAEPGDKILPIAQGGSIVVEGLVFNKSIDQLRRDATEVRSMLKVRIEEPKSTVSKKERQQHTVA